MTVWRVGRSWNPLPILAMKDVDEKEKEGERVWASFSVLMTSILDTGCIEKCNAKLFLSNLGWVDGQH